MTTPLAEADDRAARTAERVVVECRAVGRTFGRGRAAVVALHDVSCAVRPRDEIALTGRSGSGKSTLLHILAGLDRPTTGTVAWPALDGARLRPGRVAIVFQTPSLLPALNVTENAALPLVLEGVSGNAATDRAHAALDQLGIADIAAKLPDELSGGQAQRVAIARALATRPRLLLADEPTGQLDHATARVVLDALLAVTRDAGAALVVATHDPIVWERCRTRWPMSDGTLRAGSPR